MRYKVNHRPAPRSLCTFYGWFENDASIFLAMESFELGDLEKFITPGLTEKDAKVIGRQLLEGV